MAPLWQGGFCPSHSALGVVGVPVTPAPGAGHQFAATCVNAGRAGPPLVSSSPSSGVGRPGSVQETGTSVGLLAA